MLPSDALSNTFDMYEVLPSDVVVNTPFEVLGEGAFGVVLKATYVNGDAVIKLSRIRDCLPIQEECKCHWHLSKITTCVADLKGFVKESHDGKKSLRECFNLWTPGTRRTRYQR